MISVIIPVYNAENTIERCLESVKKQTYSNWEMIVVDDGSSDSSGIILDRAEQNDNRIHVIHQENHGAGFARNNGILRATGEYIVFLDSDDEISPIYFEQLDKCRSDVVFIDVNRQNEDGSIVEEAMSKYEGMSKDDFIRAQLTGKILWGGVRKAAKRELLTRHHILYSENTVGEEALYSFKLLYHAESIEFIRGSVYTYFVHKDSLSHSVLADPWGEVALLLRNCIQEMGCYEEYATTLNAFIATAAVVSLDKIAQQYPLHEYLNKAKKRYAMLRTKIDRLYHIDYKHMSTKAILIYMLMRLRMFRIIFCLSRIRSTL